MQFAGISFTQGRIKAVGTDAKGKYWDWQIDAGYPTNIRSAKTGINVIDGKTRLLKVGTGDCGARAAESLGPGLFRLHRIAAGVAVDDWLVDPRPRRQQHRPARRLQGLHDERHHA